MRTMIRIRPRTVLATALPLLLGVGIPTESFAESGTTAPEQDAELRIPLSIVPDTGAHSRAYRALLHRDPSERVSLYVTLRGRAVVDLLDAKRPLDDEENVARARRHLNTLGAQRARVVPQIESLGGEVHADLRRLVNALQIRIPIRMRDRVAAMPDVVRVEPVPMRARSLSSAVPTVGADRLWSAPGIAATGKGIRVGIVDTGIDYLHADFGGSGDPADYEANDRTIIEPGTFPTVKVAGGHDFVGDDYDASKPALDTPKPDDDPLDCYREQAPYIAGGHGTHVAGIAAGMGVNTDGSTYAGPYEASLNPGAFRVFPGVAPEATLYALRIFGCDGATDMIAAALEWAVDPNGDGDLSDRLDVINLSLGGSYGLQSVTEAEMVTHLTQDAGVLMVVAAGNSGNVFYVAGDPSTYNEAMSVAATTDQVSYLALQIDSPPAVAGEVPCAEATFTKPLASTGPLSGQLAATSPKNACSALTNAGDLAGKIALIDRGTCTFASKVQRAQDAGALAVVVVNNNAAEPPFAMPGDGSQVTIPGVMVRTADGDALKPYLAQGVMVTMDPDKPFETTVKADQMADFSSRGPRALDGALKPDIAAPGVAIMSAGVGSGTDPREMGGTSMACPMVTGAAALMREVHPDFSPMEIKALMMNTTAPLADSVGNPTPVSLAGAGRIRVDEAAMRQVTVAATEPVGAVSVSFGVLVTHEPLQQTKSITLTNHGTEAQTYDVAVAPTYELTGATATVSSTTVTVPAQSSATVDLTLDVDPAQLPLEKPDPHTPPTLNFGQGQVYGRHFLTEAAGHVTFTPQGADASEALRVPYHAVVRAADRRAASLAGVCALDATGPAQIPIAGETVHKEPLTTAFELVMTKPVDPLASPEKRQVDLTAVGVATNTATAESFGEASVYFAVGVAGEWTTPAKGGLSVVGVAIDTNEDGHEDYMVFAEPLSDQWYQDVLTAITYDLSTDQPVSYRFLNLFPRDSLNSEPFNNSAVVLPVSLNGLNVSAEDPGFRFYAFTIQLVGSQSAQVADSTDWFTYDPTRPAIDTARGGQGGVPFYRDHTPVTVHVNEDFLDGNPAPQVLLLHHSNERGMRTETVDLAQIEQVQPTDLAVTQRAPMTARPGELVNVDITVKNVSGTDAMGVRVTGSYAGGATVEGASPSQGTCDTSDGLDCALGDLAAGAEATVQVQVRLADASMHALVHAGDAFDCESEPGNNVASSTVAIPTAGPPTDGGIGPRRDAAPPLDVDTYDPAGGCSCEIPKGGDGGTVPVGALAALAGASILWNRRRRGAA